MRACVFRFFPKETLNFTKRYRENIKKGFFEVRLRDFQGAQGRTRGEPSGPLAFPLGPSLVSLEIPQTSLSRALRKDINKALSKII